MAHRLMSRALSCKTGLQSKFCVVQGLQWGQEGKRKLLNVLAPDYDYSCRFNGGKSSEPSKSSLYHYCQLSYITHSVSSSAQAFSPMASNYGSFPKA